MMIDLIFSSEKIQFMICMLESYLEQVIEVQINEE